MKHIDVRFHKRRELIVTRDIVLEKMHTSENAVDIYVDKAGYLSQVQALLGLGHEC